MRAVRGFLLGLAIAVGTAPGYQTKLADAFVAPLRVVETQAMRYAVTTLRQVARLQPEGKCNEHCC